MRINENIADNVKNLRKNKKSKDFHVKISVSAFSASLSLLSLFVKWLQNLSIMDKTFVFCKILTFKKVQQNLVYIECLF